MHDIKSESEESDMSKNESSDNDFYDKYMVRQLIVNETAIAVTDTLIKNGVIAGYWKITSEYYEKVNDG